MSTDVMKASGIDASSLLSVTARSPQTQSTYRRVVAKWIKWAGDRPLSARLFHSWIESERKAGASASKIRQHIFGGKAAIMQAAERSGMGAAEYGALKAALDSIKAPEPASPEISVVDGHERHEIIKELSPRIALVCRFLYATAARVSEALAVRESDVRVVKSAGGTSVRVRLHGKGNKERWTTLPAALLAEINDEYQKPGRVFMFESSPGKPYGRQWITHEISRAAKIALGRRVTSHDMRHSRATDLFAKTHNLPAVSRYLGHSSISVTSMYYVKTELTDAELEEEMT